MGLMDNYISNAPGISTSFVQQHSGPNIYKPKGNFWNELGNNLWANASNALGSIGGAYTGNAVNNLLGDKSGISGALLGGLTQYGLTNASRGNWGAFSGQGLKTNVGGMASNTLGNLAGYGVSQLFGDSQLGQIAGSSIGGFASQAVNDFTKNAINTGSLSKGLDGLKGNNLTNGLTSAGGALAGGLASYGINKLTGGKDYGLASSIGGTAIGSGVQSGLAALSAGSSFGSGFASGALGGLKNGAIGALGAIGGNLIGGGRSVGTFSDINQGIASVISLVPGWGTLASAAINLANGVVNNLWGVKADTDAIDKFINENNNQRNLQAEATTLAGIDNDFNNYTRLRDVTADDVVDEGVWASQSKIDRLGNGIAEQINRDRHKANAAGFNNLVDRNDTLHNLMFQNSINDQYSLGGFMGTHGADFTNDVVQINTGGSHENNPHEGVQIGVDSEGTPNLVEEGEVIYNDYVYSNRLTVPKKMRDKYKLGKKKITYADAVKKLSKESEERPNDPISANGLQALMVDFANNQEEMRIKNQNNQFAYGGKKGNIFEGPGSMPNKLNSYNNYTKVSDGWYTQEYKDFWNFINNNRNSDIAKNLLADINSGKYGKVGGNTFNFDDILRLAGDGKKGPVHQAFENALKSSGRNKGTIEGVDIPLTRVTRLNPVAPIVEDEVPEEELKLTNPGTTTVGKDSFADKLFKYAPVLGDLGALAYNALTPADFSNAERIEAAANEAGTFTPIIAPRINNRLKLKDFDTDYYARALRASNASANRSIAGLSGGNRAAALANIMANNQKMQGILGDLWLKGEQYNQGNRIKEAEYNRGTDVYNAGWQLQADTTNLNARQAAANAKINGIIQGAMMRNQIESAHNAGIANAYAKVFDDFGNIYKDNKTDKYMSALIGTGAVKDLPKAANGGKINRKKRRGGLTY